MSAVAPALASSWSTEMELACHKLWSSFPFHSRNLQAKIIIAEIFARPWSAQCNESKCFLKKQPYYLSIIQINFPRVFLSKIQNQCYFQPPNLSLLFHNVMGLEIQLAQYFCQKKLARNMLHLVLTGFPLGLWLLHH